MKHEDFGSRRVANGNLKLITELQNAREEMLKK